MDSEKKKKEELKSERSIVIGQSRTEDRATVFTIIGLQIYLILDKKLDYPF